MENIANSSNFSTTANGSTLLQLLPIGAVAFAPFLLLELVVAIVSNAILLALVILACAKKLNNNINIYLFSLAIGGLIGAFNIFCVLALVAARRWALSFTICNVSYYLVNVYHIFFLFIYLAISRDKLKAVKDPFHGRSTKKRAYKTSVAIWTISLGVGGVPFFPWVWSWKNINQISDIFIEHGNFICYGYRFTSQRVNERSNFILLSFFTITFWTISTIVIVTTFSNFVRILRELRALKKLRQRLTKESQTNTVAIRINWLDKPLYHTGEERTAKSLTLVYYIHFGCVFISYAMGYIQIIRNFVLPPENTDGPDFQIYFVMSLIFLFFPCTNPIFLILCNKRLRTRVKELLKCTLNPEVEASPMRKMKKSIQENCQ